MKHKKTLESLEEAFREIVDISHEGSYHSFTTLWDYVSIKIKKDSEKDKANKKPNLSKHLENASNYISKSTELIFENGQRITSVAKNVGVDYKFLAEEMGNLTYGGLAYCISDAALAIKQVAKKDNMPHLFDSYIAMDHAAEEIKEAERICEPYMPHDKDPIIDSD